VSGTAAPACWYSASTGCAAADCSNWQCNGLWCIVSRMGVSYQW